MTRSKTSKQLGRTLERDRKRQQAVLRAQGAPEAGSGLTGPSSVLEQSNLDELIATVEIRKERWGEVTGEAEFADEGPILISATEVQSLERSAAERRELLSIPRRPAWEEGMSAEHLAHREAEAFVEWRRSLAKVAQEEGFHLTAYERNLDFWRQLWRCAERSDLLVQIVDARDPEFYRSRDLEKFVQDIGEGAKRMVLLINKADFLTLELRAAWSSHFNERSVDVIFFSALREVQRQERTVVEEQGHTTPQGTAASPEEQEPSQEPGWQEEVPTETSVTEEGPSPPALDPVDVPVPGLDSDDDLAEVEGNDEVDGSTDEDSDVPLGAEASEAFLGPLLSDDAGVVDAAQLLEELIDRLPPRGAVSSDRGDHRSLSHRGTIGFVGFPNVGKSTVINALIGAKKVGMSKRPGKTKHIQTLELAKLGVTLCDCPGLVFPSIAATKAHLVINNTIPIDDLHECFSPINLIVERIGFRRLLAKYGCQAHVEDAQARSGDHQLDSAHSFLAALAVSRNHFLRVGVPDENWAARKVLRDYVTGMLLYCEAPSGYQHQSPAAAETGGLAARADVLGPDANAAATSGNVEEEEAPSCCNASEFDDFGDVVEFIQNSRGGGRQRHMTKRMMRHMNKQMLRGKMPTPAAEVAGARIRNINKGPSSGV